MKDTGFITVLLIAISLLIWIVADLKTGGAATSQLLFSSPLDTGMDFFSSVQYTQGANPYLWFGTVYPPLANLFFYFMYRMLPDYVKETIPTSMLDIMNARGTSADLRTTQAGLMEFILYTIVTILLLYILLESILRDRTKAPGITVSASTITALALCGTIGVLYAIERGNIILLALVLTLFYLKHYRSDNLFFSEAALIALAVAPNLKLYPVFFGVLLLCDKKYFKAIRAAIYGLLLFVWSAGFFGGRIAIGLFIQTLTGFTETGTQNFAYFGLQGIVKMITYFGLAISGREADITPYAPLFDKAQTASYVIAVALVIFVFFINDEWKRYLYITIATFTVQQSATYTIAFLLCAFAYCRKPSTPLYFIMLLMMLPLPIFGLNIPIEGYPAYTFNAMVPQICYSILLIYCLYSGILCMLNSRKGQRQ